MTLHTKGIKSRLVCHHCGEIAQPPTVCSHCRSAHIKQVGVGTQRVEREPAELYPDARILRADRDTTATKKGFENIYYDFKNHKADILIGTQMIAKGLDIPNVNLVGVILADVGLHIPDFRSGERTFQLLTQVAGRAGRSDKRGQVIIQTYSPTHPAITCAAQHDYCRFYETEIEDREVFQYPPFQPIMKLTYEDTDKHHCYSAAKRMYDLLVKIKSDAQLLAGKADPNCLVSYAPAALPRLHGKYRWHVYLQGDAWTHLITSREIWQGWKIDRDPQAMG